MPCPLPSPDLIYGVDSVPCSDVLDGTRTPAAHYGLRFLLCCAFLLPAYTHTITVVPVGGCDYTIPSLLYLTIAIPALFTVCMERYHTRYLLRTVTAHTHCIYTFFYAL